MGSCRVKNDLLATVIRPSRLTDGLEAHPTGITGWKTVLAAIHNAPILVDYRHSSSENYHDPMPVIASAAKQSLFTFMAGTNPEIARPPLRSQQRVRQ